MDFVKLFEEDDSRECIEAAAKWIGQNPDRFEQLMQHAQVDHERTRRRILWTADKVVEKFPEQWRNYQFQGMELIATSKNSWERRHYFRMFASIMPHEDLYGTLFDTTCALMQSPDEDVAVKVHSMEVAGAIACEIPELKDELIEIIEDQFDKNSIAFKTRAKAISKKYKLAINQS